MTQSTLDTLCALLNEAYQMGALVADDGMIHLMTPEGLNFSISHYPEPSQWIFHAVVAELNGPNSLPLFASSLKLNLFQEHTGSGAIGLDAASQTLIFSERYFADLEDPVSLLSKLDAFCERALNITSQLKRDLLQLSEEEITSLFERAALFSNMHTESSKQRNASGDQENLLNV
jgi:hypothetical protein